MRSSIAVLVLLILGACRADKPKSPADSAFAAVQQRGGMAMGVDQYSSSHTFDITDNGGRISLERDSDDSLGIQQIRTHMRLVQHSFEAGDFSAPSFVHNRAMPGTDVMAAKRSVISYGYEELPRGGAVVITTKDAEARKAIAEFLEAQRTDHHASGQGH
jgi:hypothetical protein